MNNDFENKFDRPAENGSVEQPEAFTEQAAQTPAGQAPASGEQPQTPQQSYGAQVSGAYVYDPAKGSYGYSRPATPGQAAAVNGRAWEASPAVPAKKQASGKGFRVFIAATLAVFALSLGAIAAFMAMDHLQDQASPAVSGSTQTPQSERVVQNEGHGAITLAAVSTFAEDGKALTKAQVAAKCSPSTVGIVAEVEYNIGSYFSFFGSYGGGTQTANSMGSGFVYSEDGYIVTNQHVIDGGKNLKVYFADGTIADAELVGADEMTDIAVLKVDPESFDYKLVPMEIGDSDALVVGDEVIAIGCPAGIDYLGTVTDGIISAINRDVTLTPYNSNSATSKTMTLLQTNATINKGNSGGPLINTRGEIIGINNLKYMQDYEGIGFAIPINGALPVIRQILEYGEVRDRENTFVSGEGRIGISGSDITENEAEYYGIPMGVFVRQIDRDSAAAAAGLRRGDIITAYNGTEVTTVNGLNQLKSKNKAGDEVTLTVYRDANGDEESRSFDITFKLDYAK